jgi:hypothetical protein
MTIQSNHVKAAARTGLYCVIAQVGFALTVALGSVMSVVQPSLAISEEELYDLCSQYPYNVQCEGYDIPIPLNRRDGEEGLCAVNMQDIALTDRCKVLIGDESLTVYLEQGEAIAPLDDQRRTEEFTMELNSVAALTYREDESVNQNRLISNTLLFGWLGAMLTEPDKVSQVEIQFVDGATDTTSASTTAANPILEEVPAVITTDGETDAVEAIAPASNPTLSSSLVFETGREQGRSMSERIGQLTRIPVQTSL